MQASNRKREEHINLDDYDFDYGYDYYNYGDDDCSPSCPCNQRSLSEYEDFYMTIAIIVADLIVAQQNLNKDIRDRLIDERMTEYTGYTCLQPNTKITKEIKRDIAFIWPFIKDTSIGAELFSQIFGQKE